MGVRESRSPGNDAGRERLLNALFDSLAEYPMWERFLPPLRRTFGCDYASLIFGSSRSEGGEPVQFVDAEEKSGGVEVLYPDGFLDGVPPDHPVERKDSRMCGDGRGTDQALVLSLAVEEGLTACLVLWRSEGRGEFGAPALALLESLVAPLKCAIRIFYRIADLERRQIVSSAAIETADIGVLLVDPEGKVLLTNSIADVLLEAGDGLQLVHGRLRALAPADTNKLMEHVRRKAAEQQAEADWQVYAPLALPRSGNALPLTVIVRPGPAFHPLKNPLQRTAMLVLRDPGRRPLIPAVTLARLFALTPAESALASELASGASLEEAANHLGVSRNTARTQLQAVFAKTGTNRQGELVRILLSSAATLSR